MSRRGILYARFAIGVVAASFGAILVRYAGEATPLTIAAWRLGLTAIVLLPVALAHRTLRSVTRRELIWSIASGVALALHFVLWITSLRYTSVASSVLFATTHPIFVGLGAHFVLRERAGRGLILGIGLAVFGGVLIGFGDLGIGGDALRGDLLALALAEEHRLNTWYFRAERVLRGLRACPDTEPVAPADKGRVDTSPLGEVTNGLREFASANL